MANQPSKNRDVPWSDLVRFVRQLSHDLRNNLNAVELQAAYINELTEDSEMKSEIQRLREMVAQVGTNLQRVSLGLSEPNPVRIPYNAADLVHDLKQKMTKDFGEKVAKVRWEADLPKADLEIDPQLILQTFGELFTNAFQHSPADVAPVVSARVQNGQLVFTLQEQKAQFDAATEYWGREPLRKVSQGHYGLGLSRARTIVEAHGGTLAAKYDPAAFMLLTTVTLPLAATQVSK